MDDHIAVGIALGDQTRALIQQSRSLVERGERVLGEMRDFVETGLRVSRESTQKLGKIDQSYGKRR